MRHTIDASFVWLGLGLWLLFMVIFVVRLQYNTYKQKRILARLHAKRESNKKKKAPIPPMELEIRDHWIKCKIEKQLSQKSPYQYEVGMLYFTFFDANGTQVHTDSYGFTEAPEYAEQLIELLTAADFGYVRSGNYMDSVSEFYERKIE